MKPFVLILLLFTSPLLSLSDQESKDLSELAQSLYEVEDKLDHILFHFNHDVTTTETEKTAKGVRSVDKPKNPNSIHQKLKLIDNLNAGSNPIPNWALLAPGAYNSELGGPALALPAHYAY